MGGRPRYDLVIVDGPASGHAARMLTIPQAILEAVPKGPLARDAAAMRALFSDPARSAFVMVTLAEDLPARETAELAPRGDARRCSMPLGPLVVNGVPSPRVLRDPALVQPAGGPARARRRRTAPAGEHRWRAPACCAQRRQDAEQILARLRAIPACP